MKLFFAALAVLISSVAFAQNRTVTGQVTDEVTGQPVPFASVHEKGTMNGSSTDTDGHYTLTVSKNAILVFSSIGYNTVEIAVKESDKINCELPVDKETLENAVVIGYGSARKASSLVGSVQTVNSETLKNAPSSSALDQLQGQVAGLQVLSYSGVAGDNAVSMTLHGVGSLGTSSAPLYVIDGIPSSSRAIMAMNPNDIESVSVLKDASATSIYGSRASNGVVYITTKAGSYNETGSVTVRGQYGASSLANLTLYQNMMSSSELMDFWVRSGLHSEAWVKRNFIDRGYTHDTKWYEYTMNLSTPQYQTDFTIQGGGRKVSYMVSGSQYHQDGFTPGNFFDRYTVRTNIQGNPLKWLKFGTNINLSLDETQSNANWGSAANGMSNYTSGGLSYLNLPMYPIKDENGVLYPERLPSGMMNPTYWMEKHPDVYTRYGANGNVFLQLTPIRNLVITSRAGIDGFITLDNWATLPSYTQKYGGTPGSGKSTEFSYQATITNTIEYSWDINQDHKLTFLVGQEGVESNYSYYYASSQKHVDDRLLLLGNGDQTTFKMSDSYSKSRFLSFFGHVDYTLMDRYYIDAVVRNDAVSRFGADVRNAQFWSVGARWNIKKEKFMQDAHWLNDLNIKASYGTQGNASIGDYNSLGLISKSGQYQEQAGTGITQPANSKLTWENQHLLTVSLSTRMFDRLDLTVEYYKRNTTSMLMDVPNPYTSGFTSVTQNVGELQNQGIDVTLGVDILRGRDYFLRFNTTFNYNEQKIISLFDNRERWEIANTFVAYVVGKPVMFYTPIYAGVDPADGKNMWYLPGENKDVTTMDPTRVTKTYNEASLSQNTGKARYAPINGGFSLSGGWRGLSFTADFAYVLGKYLLNNDRFFYENPANFATMNTNKMVSDFWTPSTPNAKYPDWSKGQVMQFDSHLLEDASFLRLKNLQVGYSLPKKALNWTNGVLKGVKITFTGRNLLTATKYTGIDPEINSNLTYGVAGNSKQYLGGLEITF